jgi:hypothetical protein
MTTLGRVVIDRHHGARYSGIMSLLKKHDLALERGRLLVVIATIVINVVAVSLLTLGRGRTGAQARLSTS